ncbi:VCBS domain-containing protein, partial [Chitinimonas sp. PSY-7]|uniref:VCBS domain-containing protein n=1 Tax=Chitinimonas sp. PSY-7 TaxID=3459088 RepID=UPI00403FE0CD
VANSAVQYLKAGETKLETFTVLSTDGTPHEIKVTITGTNDKPVIGGDAVGSVTEDAATPTLTDSGTLTISDADTGQASFQTTGITASAGALGVMTITPNGTWTYNVANSAVQYLKAGETKLETFTVLSTDGTPHEIKVTITGTNDVPTAGDGMVSGTEDTPLVFNWADFNVADIDTPAANLSIKVTVLPVDGLLQYSADGTNWAAVTVNQRLTKAMIDAGRVRFMPDSNESGSDAFGGVGVGNWQADYARFSYVANDGSANSTRATMRVDITPVADGVNITGGSVGAGNSGAPPAGNGLTVRQYTSLANISPSDVNTLEEVQQLLNLLNAAREATSTISATPQNGDIPTDGACRISGLIYLEAGKRYTFGAYQDDTGLLRVGGTEILARPYNSFGNISGSELRPTVSGYYTIDWAVYNGNGVGAFRPSLSVDGGTARELTSTNFRLYSSLGYLDRLGGLHDVLVRGADNEGGFYPRVYQGMEDSPITLSPLQYGLIDTDGSETNGALIAKSLLEGTVLTDGTRNFTATAGSTSVDITSWDLTKLKLTAPTNFNGTYNLELEGRSIETVTRETKVSTTTIAITVASVNDAPVATNDENTVLEDSGRYTVQGRLLGNDVDVDGDVLRVVSVNGDNRILGNPIITSYGTVQINANGTYTYTLDNNNARVNALLTGETITDRISYTIADAAGMTSTAVLTIRINGNSEQVVLWGSNGDDVIRDHYGENASPMGISNNAFRLNLGGAALGRNPSTNVWGLFNADAAGGAQVINAGAGDDYVESGEGNDVVYTGGSTSTGHLFSEIRNHALMITNDGAGHLLQNNGTFLFDTDRVPELDGRGEGNAGFVPDFNVPDEDALPPFGVDRNTGTRRWADIVNGGGGNDALIGDDGYDLLYGGRGDDYLAGGKGMDGLRGGEGNDRLEGGAGNDVLRGDLGADVFAWTLGDQAARAGATQAGNGNDFGVSRGIGLVEGATDLVMDFSKAEGDKLDLRDLLQGESHLGESAGNLSNYLHFEFDRNTTRTIVHISSDGGFANGVYDISRENQSIVLQNVNLTRDDLDNALLNNNAIIQDLLRNNRLITD